VDSPDFDRFADKAQPPARDFFASSR
jgi:hypothetical protein